MDKPFQTKPYAGLIIYRVQKNIEYLLLNDSFSNKKHWFCPKGQIIGNEDDIKCALRETFEVTGLRPTDLRIEEGFSIELKYLSGTKPKKVKYYLAQLVNNHVRLLPNAEGIHMQFFIQATCTEKVIFKSMQEVFRYAQTFIESRVQQRKKLAPAATSPAHHTPTSLSPHSTLTSRYNPTQENRAKVKLPSSNGADFKPRQSPQQSPPQQASPLYKTRLCERFETEGSCPYGAKCNFAHGVNELRGKTESPSPQPVVNQKDNLDGAGNQLFKTKLCEKFMKDKFCQYGPKCHFAHGENELKTRPKKAEEVEQQQQQQRNYMRNDTHDHAEPSLADQRSNWRSTNHNNSFENNSRSSELSWRSPNISARQSPSVPPKPLQRTKSSDEEENEHHANRETSWRLPRIPSPNVSTVPAASPSLKTEQVDPLGLEDLRRPAFVEHQSRSKINAKKSNGTLNKDKKVAKTDTNEKSWMKIVKLSKEEQDQMESEPPLNKHTNDTKATQTETIIAELKRFFASHPTTETTKGKLSEDVKEVTKIEMRNDLSKKQLLYVLLVSLLEEESDQSMLSILRQRDHLFRTFVKTKADQLLLLKAWNHLLERKSVMVNKTAAALSHWYDVEMVEEEAFLEWYNTLEKGSTLEVKSAKFIEWLNESDNEDE